MSTSEIIYYMGIEKIWKVLSSDDFISEWNVCLLEVYFANLCGNANWIYQKKEISGTGL